MTILASGSLSGAEERVWICGDETEQYSQPTLSADGVRIAAIGDYGWGGDDQQRVADLVNGWQPDAIITLGDNMYDDQNPQLIDQYIGAYFHAYIGNYRGSYGRGAAVNRFFPVMGNHDWYGEVEQAYLDYFTLPGNERYYQFQLGSVDFFALSSDGAEPDGTSEDSLQAEWLQQAMAASSAAFQVVMLHHPPYSSGQHGSQQVVQWSFAEWGADAVLSGHDHTYERLTADGIPYFVNGLGGGQLYQFEQPFTAGSEVRYNCDHGAMLIEATADAMTFQFISVDGIVRDTLRIEADVSG